VQRRKSGKALLSNYPVQFDEPVAPAVEIPSEANVLRHPALLQGRGPGAASFIVLEGLSFRYGAVPALHDVSLSLHQGEILALVGPSGCGKSTLLRLLAGLATPSAGQITVDGRMLSGPGMQPVPAEQRGVGLVFQDHALFPHLTVMKNVLFGVHRLPVAERQARAREVLELVGLQDYGARYPHELSGGQQQRVALARALAPRPKVLLMDEPFSGLDMQSRSQIRREVLSIISASGTTAILVTHDPEEAMLAGDRVAVMVEGRIIQQGTPQDVYRRPLNAYVAGLFGEVNQFSGTVEAGALTLPTGGTLAIAAPEGSRHTMLVRPEHVRLSATRLGSYPAVRGVVTDICSCGPQCTLEIDIGLSIGGSLRLKARATGFSIPAVGAPVFVMIDVQHVHVAAS
jgi:iron(III) transport system ATP-binding protein